MSLSQLTDRDAVVKAMKELDDAFRSGEEEALLRRYGFGTRVSYFVESAGRRYPSKALAGVAYKYQHGRALKYGEFSGGNATVASRLSDLGFIVTRPGPGWDTIIGSVSLRSELKNLYGGSSFGGIEPSGSTPNVLLFTDPDQGVLNGYNFDKWGSPDRSIFYYTGEGREGDQVLNAGNKALLNHLDDGRVLRLFETVDKSRRPGGKRQRYEGAFRLDPLDPFRREEAPDRAGDLRQVIVFKLLRDELYGSERARGHSYNRVPIEVPATPAPSMTSAADPSTHGGDKGDYQAASVVPVASEQNDIDEFEVAPREGSTARRQEAQLVAAFENHLGQLGNTVHRWRISVLGEPTSLVTDTFDATTSTLYEAKSSVDRSSIRLAVGQLLDYLRFLPGARGCVLLPAEPSLDLIDFVQSCGFQLAYPHDNLWITTGQQGGDSSRTAQ